MLELVRAPAALTVLGDTMVGATGARGVVGVRGIPLSVSSAFLYSAGMALNDYADADLDAIERPERPIPSGRIPRDMALGIAASLTAAGVVLAFTAGRASGLVSLALSASVWTYDLFAKSTPAGPALMALCRGLDVMMGAAGPGWRGGVLPAGLIAAHTAALTALSQGEVHGTNRATAGAAAAVTTVTAVLVPATAPAGGSAAAMVGAAGYAAATLPAQLDTVRTPDAGAARTATRQGIRAMIPLQIALVARTGSAWATGLLVGVGLVGRALTRDRAKGDVT
ncbi:SCO3242 family prenyltransferase [Microbacterium sp. NPDC019599]|uniref:SCO3242 family prenyltransferase n=1 Tax=Microbacterium sp. NPDC019599 TaxID=3154690 RepID=UPI0033C8DF2F